MISKKKNNTNDNQSPFLRIFIRKINKMRGIYLCYFIEYHIFQQIIFNLNQKERILTIEKKYMKITTVTFSV